MADTPTHQAVVVVRFSHLEANSLVGVLIALLSPLNSTTSICKGFVRQQVAQQQALRLGT